MKTCTSVYLILILLPLVHLKPVEESDYWGFDKDVCVRELRLNREKIKALDEQEIVREDDPEFNVFAQCFFVRSGIQDTDGEIKYDKIKNLFEQKIDQSVDYADTEKVKLIKKIAVSAVAECEKLLPPRSSNPGQLAVKVGNCIMQHLKDSERQILDAANEFTK